MIDGQKTASAIAAGKDADDLKRLGDMVLRRRAHAMWATAALAPAIAAVWLLLAAAARTPLTLCWSAALPLLLSVVCALERRCLARRMRAGLWPDDETDVRDALEALYTEQRAGRLP